MKRLLNNILLTYKTIENFPIFFLDYLGFLKGYVIYKIKNKEYQFFTRAGTADKAELVAVMSGFEYRFDLLPKMKNPIIFDVGAYIGDSALYAYNFYKKKCRIFSFEADSENFKMLQINLLINNISGITYFPIAIGTKNGTAILQKRNKPSDAHMATAHTKSEGVSCQMKTIQQMVKELRISRIDILKMDIEGGEYEIFNNKSSYAFVKKNVKYVFLEYHYDFGLKRVIDLIKKLERDFITIHHRNNLIFLKNKIIA